MTTTNLRSLRNGVWCFAEDDAEYALRVPPLPDGSDAKGTVCHASKAAAKLRDKFGDQAHANLTAHIAKLRRDRTPEGKKRLALAEAMLAECDPPTPREPAKETAKELAKEPPKQPAAPRERPQGRPVLWFTESAEASAARTAQSRTVQNITEEMMLATMRGSELFDKANAGEITHIQAVKDWEGLRGGK